MRFLGVLFSLSVLLSSCMQIEAPEIRSVVCCDIKKALKTETEIGFKVEVYNGNDFPIQIKKQNLEVRLNGNTLGNSKPSEPTTLEPGKVQTFDVTITTSSQQLISGTLVMGLTALMRNEPTTLEVEVVGTVVGSAKGVSKKVKIREKYPLKMHP
jgi:LEA14-like dessication related protein